MHLAEERLTSTDDGVSAVARLVGYDSEEAFSRAFRRSHGVAPSAWRSARRAPARPPVDEPVRRRGRLWPVFGNR
jgi:AraC-like DNA-binding protein